MSQRAISPFYSFLLQAFFGAVAVGGVLGFRWTWGLIDRYRAEGRDPGLTSVFLILTVALVAVGARGIWFTRREIGDDPDLRPLALRSRQENILGGFALLALGAGLTASSLARPGWLGQEQRVFYGLIVLGVVQIIVGASRAKKA